MRQAPRRLAHLFAALVCLAPMGFAPIGSAALGLAAIGLALPDAARAEPGEATWASIRTDIFGDRAIEEGSAVIDLGAPPRAEDAALVPIDIRIHAVGDQSPVRALTLIIDENPAPVAATFTVADSRHLFDLSTRVRVNSYSFVRVVAETDDGRLHMVKAYVKAAGGCSAPASKDPAEARANAGQMRFRSFAELGRDEAQVQIRHPNNSGLQMDQVTRLFTPAWFIQDVTVSQGSQVLLRMEGGISISEDPTFRFSYRPTGEAVDVVAKDTDGHVFRQSFRGGQGS